MSSEQAFLYLFYLVFALVVVYHVVTAIADGKKRLTEWMKNKREAPALVEAKRTMSTRQSVRRMLWGGAAFVIGALATAASYSASMSSGSGSYRMSAGLMAVGGVYALVGLLQYITKWDLN